MAQPKVIAAPKIGFHFKDAVIVQTEHDKDAAALGFGQDTIKPPGVIHMIIELVSPVPFEPEGLGPHPNPDVVNPRFLTAFEPIVVIVRAPASRPADTKAL